MIIGAVASFASREGPRQFLKFCIVGATSTVIDFGLLNLFHYQAGLPLALAATLSFSVAVCNGFYWNRHWTFRARQGDARSQYAKFVTTNIVGWLLNLFIMTVVLIVAEQRHWIAGRISPTATIEVIALGQGRDAFPKLAVNGAKAVATIFVTVWNFTASRLWTFRKN